MSTEPEQRDEIAAALIAYEDEWVKRVAAEARVRELERKYSDADDGQTIAESAAVVWRERAEAAEARVREAEADNEWLNERVKRLGVSHAEKRERVRELEAELAWYADPDTWEPHQLQGGGWSEPQGYYDKGVRAREVLAARDEETK